MALLYAHEVGCCEVIVGETVEEMRIGDPCDCIARVPEFDPDYDDPEFTNFHCVRDHVTEFGVPDRLGKRCSGAHTRGSVSGDAVIAAYRHALAGAIYRCALIA